MTVAPISRVASRSGVTRLAEPAAARTYARSATSGVEAGGSHASLSQSLTVEQSARGVPVRVLWDDRWHRVVVEPKRWFQRRAWWAEEARAERGRPGLVAHQVWRLQVRLEAAARAQVRTIDVSHDLGSGRWRLLRVHDAL